MEKDDCQSEVKDSLSKERLVRVTLSLIKKSGNYMDTANKKVHL